MKEHGAPELAGQAFKQCIVIETEEYHCMGDFLYDMAMKVARTTSQGLISKLNTAGTNTTYPVETFQQVLVGVHDFLEEIVISPDGRLSFFDEQSRRMSGY